MRTQQLVVLGITVAPSSIPSKRQRAILGAHDVERLTKHVWCIVQLYYGTQYPNLGDVIQSVFKAVVLYGSLRHGMQVARLEQRRSYCVCPGRLRTPQASSVPTPKMVPNV